MDKNEVITLSSDDENDFTSQLEKNLNCSKAVQLDLKNLRDILKSSLAKSKNKTLGNEKGVIIKNKNLTVQIIKTSKVPKKKCKLPSPEVVNLDECSEKPVDNGNNQFCSSSKNSIDSDQEKMHSIIDVIDVEEIQNENDSSSMNDKKADSDLMVEKSTADLKPKSAVTNKGSLNDVSESQKLEDQIQVEPKELNLESPDPNLNLFTEFVEFCGSLEEIPNDRARLTKKLMKRYGEAECHYIKSEEFRNIIQKCKNKVNKDNLYLIAKEITDELSYRKEMEINRCKSNVSQQNCQNDSKLIEENEKQSPETLTKHNKKRIKIIHKIIEKLNLLGNKIRELENQEVDLSDEEGSSYIHLQRCRERFCQIYRKLCKYTNEVPDADRIFERKIHFTESKYPKINKCIEIWLNKTKRFPDFSDVLKLLESQSSSLGLPSNKELIRAIAVEIFQQVGSMLQRRRKYDLWDSFCGFLDDTEDPATTDPELDEILKKNFDDRVKKEQEIFQYYLELQEKEKLEPEEVLDEEANCSAESGKEDEKEIEDIENSINSRLDDAIEKDSDENDKIEDTNGAIDEEPVADVECENLNSTTKESKNNYRNCKSLKWRPEKSLNSKNESTNSEDSNTEGKNEKEKKITEEESTKPEIKDVDNDSDLELIPMEDVKNTTVSCETFDGVQPRKRSCSTSESVFKKRKRENSVEVDILQIDCENDHAEEENDVYEVRCCQIFANNIFEDLEGEKKKDWDKRKVFRDLTNVNRLMELHGRKRKMSGLFSPSFFHRSFCEFEKSSWKKRFKVSFRLVGSKGLKCALNQDENSEKIVNSDSSGDSDEKDIQNNSEEGGYEGGEFYSGRGNGNEEDNNEDKNKKNWRDKNENEEEDEEEENESEKEDDNNEHSFQKTESDSEKMEFKDTEEEEAIESSEKELIESCENEAVETSEKEAIVEESEKELAEGSEKEVTHNSGKELLGDPGSEEEKTQEKGGVECTENDEERFQPQTTTEKQEMVEVATNPETECDSIEKSGKETEEEVKVLNTDSEGSSREKPTKEDNMKEIVNTNQEPAELEEGSNNNTEKEDYKSREVAEESKLAPEERSNGENYCIIVENKNKPTLKRTKPDRRKRDSAEVRQALFHKFPRETATQRTPRKNIPTTSDEERVKRFLLHSPSSISITPPRKLTLSKPPSQAALQALATLRNLKGISATIVKGGKPKSEDDVVVVGVSHPRQAEGKTPVATKRKRNDLPVISSVQSIDSTTPKIVTVQGNVSGFENSWPELSNDSQCNLSSIRISNVWGNLPNNFMPNETPGCSFRQSKPGSSNAVKKKNTKKTVEYVVLD